ncbi:MAG: DUF4783 domain-containing protein [Sphingobacteriales bacterium]|nr:DUF4783 domain-containing protein [Sphingobacteriales bacterium]MBI3720185.1 DUF4783 domain-containing protein [Sphingobacteriales bacterium]
MKKTLRIILLLTLIAGLMSFRFLGILDDVIGAMKAGSSDQLAKYFDNVVEITMPDKSNSYSKSQAEMIMKDFFNNYKVKSFDVLHKGDNGTSNYCIGNLQTKDGKFRTTLFVKQKGDKQFLQEIRIEAQAP